MKWGLKMANGFLEYGEHKLAIADVPVDVLHRLAQTTFSHKMGNEVAAKVNSRIAGELPDGSTKDAITAWREANKAQVDAWTSAFRVEMLENIRNGTVGTRVGGPRKDPVESKFASLVIADIVARLKGRNDLAKQFRKAKADDTIDFGNGMTRTRAQMIEATITQKGDSLRKEAEKMVRDEARLAERTAKSVEESAATPEALGF